MTVVPYKRGVSNNDNLALETTSALLLFEKSPSFPNMSSWDI